MSRRSRVLRRILLLALAVYLVCSVAAVQVMNAALFGRADEPDGLTVRYEDVAADYPRQTVTFSSGSAQLTGWLYPAEDAAALVVIAHGLGADAETYLPETMHFVDSGYSVLTYDATGTGASGGSGTRGLAQSALDLDAALTRAKQESLPILLFGHSWGGYAAAAVLGGSHDVTASVCAAGFDTPLDLMRQTALVRTGRGAGRTVPVARSAAALRHGGKRLRRRDSGSIRRAGARAAWVGRRHHPGRRSEPAGSLSKRERAEHPDRPPARRNAHLPAARCAGALQRSRIRADRRVLCRRAGRRRRLTGKWYAPIASVAALVVQSRRAREKCSGAQ